MTKSFVFAVFLILTSVSALGTDTPGIEKFSILGQKENLPTQPGSAHLITEYDLEKYDFLDIHQVLRGVPGVNLQEEDGFGLRPNIGLRGAHPHRSRKITVMEDGVLIGPAPYSAPAAYYFPTMEKIYNIEVFKGPAAVQYGPSSVGGAINLISRRHAPGVTFDVSLGGFGFQKYQVSTGFEAFGNWSVDLLRVQHDGFKSLANGGPTGFERNNVFVRWDKELASLGQELTFKWNWSDEESQETYLGLTNDDFNQNPYQRYGASQKDLMAWKHQQFFLDYKMVPWEDSVFKATVYHHRFRRSWDKFDGFFDSTLNTREILTRPYLSANRNLYEVLRGDRDSTLADDSETVRVTDNDRRFVSQGLQLSHSFSILGEALAQDWKWGYRLHQDSIDRNHTSDFFLMSGGNLVPSLMPEELVKSGGDRALAHTFYVSDSLTWDELQLTAGFRLESVSYDSENLLSAEKKRSGESAFVPGLNGFYKTSETSGILFGVNKGVTLVGPGQSDAVSSEEAINLEVGYRHGGKVAFETIGFYSDYKNILGTCTLSTGCNASAIDQRFNGGEASIYGLEALVQSEFSTGDWKFPLRWSLTLTQAQFENDFASGLIDWGVGDVRKGDPLPYIPTVQSQLSGSMVTKAWSWNLMLNYVGAVADQAVAENRVDVPDFFVLNTSLSYKVNPDLRLLLRVDNVLNRRYAVSFRPFGLRPGQPLTAFLGLRYEL